MVDPIFDKCHIRKIMSDIDQSCYTLLVQPLGFHGVAVIYGKGIHIYYYRLQPAS
jgi:hypothetical protein